ncbi:hypothetical protein IAE35_23610 [Pseudomonas sp. S75]|uniref:hypothetical protein n=1 Tax=unclassified Pseudomonas TaxID=196821 RepID=UPI001906B0E4|nr:MULTISPECIES: hypothetical protein [unclassified Pseudomonas]MBJ9978381.1 hypothetical protein [Pseudomonas sp. S30]MBK0156336.1 hypothetical protein [Pseudomonas sp. S75]
MSVDKSSLDHLSQSLGREFDQRMDARRQAAIAEHEAQLAAVPPVTELPESGRVRMILVTSLVFLVVLGGWCLTSAKAWLAGLALLLLAVATARSLWLQRDAGKRTLLRLTHDTLEFVCLDREVSLLDLIQAHVKEGRQMKIVLTLREGAALPGTRNTLGPWLPKAKVKPGKAPEIICTFFGLTHQGKVLDNRQVMGMLLDYCACAAAKVELAKLRGQG